jgi:hypothetical protein
LTAVPDIFNGGYYLDNGNSGSASTTARGTACAITRTRSGFFILVSRRPASVIAGQSGQGRQERPFRPYKIEQISRD